MYHALEIQDEQNIQIPYSYGMDTPEQGRSFHGKERALKFIR